MTQYLKEGTQSRKLPKDYRPCGLESTLSLVNQLGKLNSAAFVRSARKIKNFGFSLGSVSVYFQTSIFGLPRDSFQRRFHVHQNLVSEEGLAHFRTAQSPDLNDIQNIWWKVIAACEPRNIGKQENFIHEGQL